VFDARIVVRYQDGTVLKGWGDNFLPGEASILVKDFQDRIHTVDLQRVKLVCFVKTFVSDSTMTHRPTSRVLFSAIPGTLVELRFQDGEVIFGKASLSAPPRTGFFVSPVNPNSNNISVYVNPEALDRFRFME